MAKSELSSENEKCGQPVPTVTSLATYQYLKIPVGISVVTLVTLWIRVMPCVSEPLGNLRNLVNQYFSE